MQHADHRAIHVYQLPMKAVAYLRVSGQSQIDGEGFGRRLEAVTAYAKVHDWEIIKVYREEAVPGKTEMQALIERYEGRALPHS